MNQAPNEFLERTLFKDVIEDEDYSSVLTGLDLMDVPPSVEKCKAEIRKKEAKLEHNRMTIAVRKVRMAQQKRPAWNYPGDYQNDPFEE